jgi:transposase
MQRAAIVVMDQLGFERSHIAYWIGCEERSINRWISRFNDTGSVEDEERSGRHRGISEDTEQAIVSLADEKKFITPKVIQHELSLNMSARSVRRALDRNGLFGRVARTEYPFTQNHVDERLAFANEHVEWDEAKWNSVLFSDETHIWLAGSGQVWVQRPEDAAFLPEYMTEREFHSKKISLWGAFSAHGMSAPYLFDDNMNARTLCDVFRTTMLPGALSTWPDQQWFLLQDNAPYHKAELTQTWLFTRGVDCINFPPFSPDLNPIENLWAQLKRNVEAHNPQTIEQLREIVLSEWNDFDCDYLSCLAQSMHDRCKAVIACRGFKTKY